MKLWLLRHAPPLVAEGTCYGASDVAVDPHGTLAAAQALALELPAGVAVRCSPLRRCRQLAQALEALRPDLAAATDPRLAEMDFGRWEGRPWAAIGRHELDAWTADFPGHRCGGGESVAQLMARVGAALADVRGAGRDALWVTHGGVVRAVRLLAAGIALPRRADEWPREGLGFGEMECIPLA